MRHKSNNKTRPLFTLSLEMTRLVNKTRLLLVPCFNSDIYGNHNYFQLHTQTVIKDFNQLLNLQVANYVTLSMYSYS